MSLRYSGEGSSRRALRLLFLVGVIWATPSWDARQGTAQGADSETEQKTEEAVAEKTTAENGTDENAGDEADLPSDERSSKDAASTPTREGEPDQEGEPAESSKPEKSTDQEGDSSEPNDSGQPEENLERLPNPLAESLWRHRTPRWIGLYGSQLADLIPENFRPIAIDDLAAAIRDNRADSPQLSDAPPRRLTITAEIDRERLIGQSSRLELSEKPAGDPAPAILRGYRLGRVNLALIDSASPKSDEAPARILSDGLGNCFAIGPDGSMIEFDWSARCQYTAQGRRWTLRLPDAMVTRFFLRVKSDEIVEVEGGSSIRVDQTPPDLRSDEEEPNNQDVNSQEGGYLIEPTPGQPLVLLVRAKPDAASSSSRKLSSVSPMTVVRACRLQAQWRGDQLRWTYRLTLDANTSMEFSQLQWSGGKVIAVRRGGSELPFDWDGDTVNWTSAAQSAEHRDVRLSDEQRPTSTSMTFEGITSVEGASIALPRPLFPEDHFFVSPENWHLQLEIPRWCVLCQARLPEGWGVGTVPSQSPRSGEQASDGESSANSGEATTMESPSSGVARIPPAVWVASGRAPVATDPWSITVCQNDALVFANHQVRFEMDATSIQARGRVIVEMPQGSIEPITLQLQDGFQFDFVGVGEARRSVPIGPSTNRSRAVTIWPEGKEVVDDHVIIDVSARAQRNDLAGGGDEDTGEGSPPSKTPGSRGAAFGPHAIQHVGAMWLMRVADCPGQLLATIIPPANLTWSAKAAIQPNRRSFADLTSNQRRFFAPLPGDAIVFGGAMEATPAVTLEKPDVNLSVSLKTLLHANVADREKDGTRARDPGASATARQRFNEQVWQTIEVKTEGTAGAIGAMRLRFAAEDSPQPDPESESDRLPPAWLPMQWSVQLSSDEPEISIEESAITRQHFDGGPFWELQISLPAKFTNQSRLIGRRQQKLPVAGSVLAVSLPNVPDAASQSAEVWIDPSLQLQHHHETLTGVPTVENASENREPDRAGPQLSGGAVLGRFQSPPFPDPMARYRYEPNDQPWVHVLPRLHQVPKGLVVGQRITAVASVGGTDTLRLSCLVRSDSEVELTFPPSLHLLEVRCDGVVCRPKILPGRGVVLPRLDGDRDATARVNSSPSAKPRDPRSRSRWMQIEASWISASPRSQWHRWYEFPEIEMNQLVVDSRRELLAATGTRLFELPHFAGQDSAASIPLLLPSGITSGLGWVAAFFLLGCGCWAGRAGVGAIGFGIVLAVLAAIFWPLAAIPLITFVAVPLTLAAMQLTTSDWLRDRRVQQAMPPDPSSRSPSQTARPGSRTIARESGSSTRRRLVAEIDSGEGDANEAPRDASGDGISSSTLASWFIVFALTMTALLTSSPPVYGQASGNSTAASPPAPAQRNSAAEADPPPQPSIDVLVPTRSDGKLLGNKIYIPESFYNELFHRDSFSRVSSSLIQGASYRLHLKAPAADEVLKSSDVAELTVRLEVHAPVESRRLRLPYRTEQVLGASWMPADAETVSLRWGDDGNGFVWIEIPSYQRDASAAEIQTVALSLSCQVERQSPWLLVASELPAIAMAELHITTDSTVSRVMLQNADTSRFVDFSGEKISLGPQAQLSLQYLSSEDATGPLDTSVLPQSDENPVPWNRDDFWQKRFWVHSHSGKTVVECEIEPRGSLPPEVIVTLSTEPPEVRLLETETETETEKPATRDFFCKLLDQEWRWDEGSDERLRLRSLSTPARPIRLGWTVKTPTQGAWRIRLPHVQVGSLPGEQTSSKDNPPVSDTDQVSDAESSERESSQSSSSAEALSPPWIAWTFSDDLQPDWSQIGELEPLADDQFETKWTGYLHRIDRAAVGAFNELILRRMTPPRSTLTTRHEIEIHAQSQQVRYHASVRARDSGGDESPAASHASQYTVELPPGARLLDWRFESGEGDSSSNARDTAAVSRPWKILRRKNTTQILLTSQQSDFDVIVEAMLPHAAGETPNQLALLNLTPLAHDQDSHTDSKASESGEPGAMSPARWEQSHELQVTRSVDTIIQWSSPIGGTPMDAGVQDAASLLAAGQVFVDRFATTDAADDAFRSARFLVHANAQPFDVDSRITLRWKEGRWIAQTDCVITSEYCPDYVDIALPTRWCDSLQIVPLCISSRQPTLDPSIQVLRLELRREASTTGDESTDQPIRKFRLVSRLAVSEITRVSVPEVRIVDARQHRVDVVVPTRLTNELVRWRSNFAGPIEKPRWRIDPDSPAATAGEPPHNAELSVYAVTSPGWSIDLETLPRTDRHARLIHADHRVLVRPQSEQWLMVSRFDVVPGDQVSLRLSIADSAKLLGVWAATRAADFRRLPSPTLDQQKSKNGESAHRESRTGELSDTEPNGKRTGHAETNSGDSRIEESVWEITLPWNRLSQTVEVLISLPSDTGDVLLPTLIGLPSDAGNTSINWCEIPVTGDSVNRSIDQVLDTPGPPEALAGFPQTESNRSLSPADPLTPHKRLQWLASSVVQAIGASSDSLADRRDEEVAVWLKPWIQRYRMICSAVGRRIGDSDPEDDSEGDSENVNADENVSEDESRLSKTSPDAGVESRHLLSWEEMDAYILSQETRYFTIDVFAGDNQSRPGSRPRRRSGTAESVRRALNRSSSDSSITWSDFLAVATPPGYTDRWTFAWDGRTLPLSSLALNPVPLSESTRQEVIRTGLFIALAALFLVVLLFPRQRARVSGDGEPERRGAYFFNWGHPASWLFVLGVIGLVLMPIAMALGMIATALFLGASDSWKRSIGLRWKAWVRKGVN